MLVLNIQPQSVVNADVLIGDPNQRKKRDHIAAPVWKNQFESCDREQQRGYIMTQAVLAREQIKKLAF